MKNTQNITIILLLVTASILTAMLLTTYSETGRPAYATGVSVSRGDYIMATGQLSRSTDLLYVIDIASRRMNAYVLDTNKNAIEMVDSADLEGAFTR